MEEENVDQGEQAGHGLDEIPPGVNNEEEENKTTDALLPVEQNGELLPEQAENGETKAEEDGAEGETEVVGEENGEESVKAEEGEGEEGESKLEFAGPGHFKERKKKTKRPAKKRVKVIEETSWECNECTYINNPLVSCSLLLISMDIYLDKYQFYQQI